MSWSNCLFFGFGILCAHDVRTQKLVRVGAVLRVVDAWSPAFVNVLGAASAYGWYLGESADLDWCIRLKRTLDIRAVGLVERMIILFEHGAFVNVEMVQHWQTYNDVTSCQIPVCKEKEHGEQCIFVGVEVQNDTRAFP